MRTILLLTANPKDTSQLDLDREVALIADFLAQAHLSEQFKVTSALAVTPEALRTALLEHQPDIVHFSGHGAGEDGIVLQNSQGKMQLVSTDAWVGLFGQFPKIQCVILNACYTALQASALIKYVPFAIGMNQPISDPAAIAFATGFYQALSAGQNIEQAFQLGRNAIALAGRNEANKPVLKQRRQFARIFKYLPFEHNPYFTGRAKVLRELAETLHFHGIAALSGMGGMGKTQTAIQFARVHAHEYQAILWCLADSADNLELGMANLARTLEVTDSIKQAEQIAAVLQWLETQDHWLLLFDNADDLRVLKAWLPKLRRGQVIITTRAEVTEPVAKRLPLSEMLPGDALDLLWTRATDIEFKRAHSQEILAADDLIKTLGCLPLALDQAGAYIRATGCGFAAYRDLFARYPQQLLEKRGELLHDCDHPDPVATTWLVSFEKVRQQNETAGQILNDCAFLPAEEIPEEIFAFIDPLAWNDALQVVLCYSLLRRDPVQKTLQMHRLVQLMLRAQLTRQQQQECATAVVAAVSSAFPNPEFKNWARCERLLPAALLSVTWISDYQLETEAAGLLLNQAAYFLQHGKAAYSQATRLFQQSLVIYKKVLGEEHPHVAASLNNLAELYRTQGEHAAALPLYQQSLAIFKKDLGEEHPDVATSLNNLAMLYQAQGEYAAALPLFQQSLAIDKKVYGEEHPDVATDLNNLAELYRAQGEYAAALPLYQQSLAIRKKVLGEEHPDVATSLNNLAVLYYAQGEYASALPLFQQSLAIRKKVLGEEHPDVATSLNNLAALYYVQGDYTSALPLFQQVVKIFKNVLGEEHPDVATSLNNLAELYRAQGEYAAALPLYQQSLAIRKKVLGEEHPDVAASLNNLAMLYEAQGNYPKAKELYEQAIPILLKTLGERHPRTQTGIANYKDCLVQMQLEKIQPRRRWWQFWK